MRMQSATEEDEEEEEDDEGGRGGGRIKKIIKKKRGKNVEGILTLLGRFVTWRRRLLLDVKETPTRRQTSSHVDVDDASVLLLTSSSSS